MLKTSRRDLLKGIAAAGVFGALPGGLAHAADAAGRPDLRIGANGLPRSLEPINGIGNTGIRILNQLYDTLIVRDFFHDGAAGDATALVPGLAERWERLDDRTVRFTLRQGVLFHNGVEMTADDVAFSFSSERLWGDAALKGVPNGRAFSPDFDEPVVESRYSVLIKTKTPSYLIEKFMASWVGRVVPRDYYRQLGAEGFGNAPVGTGPYKLAEFRPNDRVVIEAFDGYWGAKPTAARIIFQSVPEPATRVAGLISGEYDIVTTLTPDDMAMIQRFPNFETRGMNIENFQMFVFNMNQPIFKDNTLRRAMALAVNRPLLNQSLWHDMASLPRGFNFPHYGATYDPNRDFFRYDPAAARDLVKQSGYDGRELTYLTFGNYYANAVPAMMMMIEMWRDIGVKVVPLNVAQGSTVPNEQVYLRNWSNGMSLTDAATTLVTEFGPGRQVQTRHGWQAPAEFNELALKVMQIQDGPERSAAFSRMRDIFEAESPAVPLYRPFDVYAARKDVIWHPVSFEMMELRANNLKFA
ncbi:ABC transporter substrate-binding protein [Kaistia dalseonensis]|uniref:Peptide/nickel transport system substrate-binding protein n=1 Tax=Kaistia dalseonensis TaxID=410840 RepID=A0ABU0H1U0_9HYPH|nr:ABC transporter substrate-binding protein [Kaistia dalseonensis]MCX5493718.1 ABC transporter substrate-binding protein [Kaistia dalseonensis]MDQ0436282.1 peptide/nickel transport system substrate-binding protein [Kaistia dalseonensis]